MKKAICILLVTLLLFTGCGGSDKPAEPSSQQSAATASESAASPSGGGEIPAGASEFKNPDGYYIGTGELSAESLHPDYPFTLSIEKNEFAPDEEMAITFSDEGWLKDSDAWVGIVPASTPHGDEETGDEYDYNYFYPTYSENNKDKLAAYGDAGNYELRVYSSDEGGVELCFIPFTVK